MKDARTFPIAAALALVVAFAGPPSAAQEAPRPPSSMSAVGPIPGPPQAREPRTDPLVRNPGAMATGRPSAGGRLTVSRRPGGCG